MTQIAAKAKREDRSPVTKWLHHEKPREHIHSRGFFCVLETSEQSCYTDGMDKPTPSETQLLDALLDLLRAGCEIRLTPQPTGLGYIYADVRVIPPPPADPQSPLQEWAKLKTGAAVSLPYHSDIELYYHPEGLQRALEGATMLYVRRPPTSA